MFNVFSCNSKLPKLIKQNESTEKIATLTIVLFAHHLFIKKLKFEIYVFSTCEMLLTSSKIEIKPIVEYVIKYTNHLPFFCA